MRRTLNIPQRAPIGPWATASLLSMAVILGHHSGISLAGEPAAIFDALDADRSGTVTGSEVTDAQRGQFDRLLRRGDRNQDGQLTREEFLAGLEEPAPVDIESQASNGRGMRGNMDPQRMIAFMDRNQDGFVSLEELPEIARPRLTPLFDAYMTNRMKVDDLVKLMTNIGGGKGAPTRPTPSAAPAPTSAPPANTSTANDGERSLAAARMFFQRMDSNRDGLVTAAEAPERAQPLVRGILQRLGLAPEAGVTLEQFASGMPSEMRAGMQPGMTQGMQPGTGPKRPGLKPSAAPDGASRPTMPPGRETPTPAAGEEGAGLMFRRLDGNNDGMLSRDEVGERMRGAFDRMDADSNGTLNPAEFISAFDRRKKPD